MVSGFATKPNLLNIHAFHVVNVLRTLLLYLSVLVITILLFMRWKERYQHFVGIVSIHPIPDAARFWFAS